MFLDRGGVKNGAHEEKEAMRSKVLCVPVSYRQFSTYLFITFSLDQPHLCRLTGLDCLCDEVVPGISFPT